MQEPAPQHGHDRLDFIQALRGIAALGVVLYHCKIFLVGVSPQRLDWGAAGVDLFFVVSGFIMVHATARSDGSIRYVLDFLCKRLARIWPVYLFWTIVYMIVVERDRHFWIPLAKAIVFYPAALHRAPLLGGTPNGVGWTLNFEVWFYVLFALSMLARRWRWVVFAALIAGFTIAVPLAFTGEVHASAYHDYELPSALLRLLANPMTWDFAAGVAIGLVYRSRFQIRHERALKTFVILAVTFEIWTLGEAWRAGYGPDSWGAPIIGMVLALALWNKHRRIAVPRALIWLGDLSFSLYLIHRVVLLGGLRYLPLSLVGGFPYIGAMIVLSLLLASESARYLERGLADRLRVRLVSAVNAVFHESSGEVAQAGRLGRTGAELAAHHALRRVDAAVAGDQVGDHADEHDVRQRARAE